MATNKISLSFEDALEELQNTVQKLERGELSLEEALALYERGQLLASYCNGKLEEASLRVETLTTDGEIVQLPVD